jgi:Rieske Fe-S protein
MAPDIPRRTVVVGAAALGAGLTVTGCTTVSTAPAATTGGPIGSTSDVPVGSGTIFAGSRVVVTQPEAGTFTAFDAACPHQGCNVGSVEGAEIVCPCHGSRFGLDGAVLTGPATTGLAPVEVVVEGDRLTFT